jgi:transcription termination factor Rho
VAAEALEQSVLEGKDKDQLLAIAKALGVKASARTKKSDIIAQILETTGVSRPTDERPDAQPSAAAAASSDDAGAAPAPAAQSVPPAQATTPAAPEGSPTTATAGDDDARPAPAERGAQRGNGAARSTPPVGDDGEPLAEWELAFAHDASDAEAGAGGPATPGANNPTGASGSSASPPSAASPGNAPRDGDGDGDGEGRNRRRRRRRKGRGNDGPQGEETPSVDAGEDDAPVPSEDAVEVAGYLDLRDEGYGFLRVNGYLASRDDAYVPVKLARQFGLRKGDHVVGTSRPPGRNEKNPALLEVHSVNGGDPDEARRRPRFEDLTALFPDERLRLEDPADPTNMTARIIDLVAPIGKGQRGIIVSPPKAGKTMVMKTIAAKIEKNNPEVKLIILLIDERPEEVTDIRRSVQGEVVASTFDRPSEEHTHVAELVIEKAKRLVEQGEDVVVILDGITRLSRAYNLAAPPSGRILSGGIDAGALYPPKRFFGAARNVEEGGSLTILATALVETNSRMDEAIFEEFKGTGNMELRLDRRLAERRIFPAIDVDASSTRHEELLFDRKQLQMVWKLRRVLSGLAADGSAAPGLELLMDRLKTFRTNEEFLNELAKQGNV